MKAAMKSNAAHFSARRMVKEYMTNYYVPAIMSTLDENNVEGKQK